MNFDRRSVRAWLASGVSSAVLGALIATGAGQAVLAQTKDKAAAADAANEEGTTVEAVTVTGTFLRGTPTTATLPVEAMGVEEMRDRGSPSPVELIKQMSEVGSTVGESNRNNLFAVGAAAINLRSLGPNRTVVLFNGRRWPETFSFSVGRYININQLPSAAVGRIETLKDGGATTYGADAVGGVVNYITRRGFNGIEATANYRYVKDADGDYDASILMGKKIDNFDILGSLSYEHKSELQFNDRDWSIVDYLTNPGAWIARTNPGSFALSTSTNGTTFTAINPGNFTGNRQMGASGVMRDPACQALGGFNGWSAAAGNVPVCWQPGNYLSNLAEKQNAWHAYAEANWEISPKLKIHGEFVYYGLDIPNIPLDTFTNTVSAWPLVRDATGAIVFNNGVASTQTVPGSTLRAYYVPGTNPAVANLANSLKNQDGTLSLTSAQLAALAGPNGRVALPEGIWRPWDIGGSLYQGRTDYQHNSSDQYRYTLEFSGELFKIGPSSWDWSFAGTYNDIAYHYEAPDIPVDRLQAALNGFGGPSCTGTTPGANGCMFFNPFSSAIQKNLFTGDTNPYFVGSGSFTGYTPNAGLQNSPDLVKWLYSSPATMLRTMDYTVFDFLVRGDLGYKLWADDTISLAVGAQYRELHEIDDLVESADLTNNPCATAGLTGPQCGTNRNGTTVFQRGALVTGFRQDYNRRYPVYAGFSEVRVPVTNTLNVQASVRWEKFWSDVGATNNETVVAAGGVRWQALPWLAFRGTAGQSFGQISPPGPAAAVPSAATTVPAAYGSGAAAYTTTNWANPGIRPETGFNYNVGAVIQAGDVTATIDYYDIKLDSIASSLSAAQVMTGITDITTAGANTLVNCGSRLFTEGQGAFGGKPFVEVTNTAFHCTQGQTTMQQFLQSAANGGAQPIFNFFGSQGQENRTYNGPGLETSGIDVNVVWRKADIWSGDLTVTGDVSYVLKYQRDPYVLAGQQVAPGFDGVGYTNTGGIRSGERVYAWRGSLTLNYRRGIHNFNVMTRIIPGLATSNDTLFNAGSLPTAAQNANIGTANGFTDMSYCLAHGSGQLIAPPTPNAAGTAEYGVRTNVSAAIAIGLDPCQNTLALAGAKIPASFSTDATYRINLPQNTTLTVGVQNLFDVDPAFSRDATNYDPGGAQGPLGRTYRLGVVKRW